MREENGKNPAGKRDGIVHEKRDFPVKENFCGGLDVSWKEKRVGI